MYEFVTLTLAASALALPHNRRVLDGPTSTAPAFFSCPGAPAIPEEATPGDACAIDNSPAPIDSSIAPNPSSSPPAARAVAPRRRKVKKDGFSTCQVVTLDQYKSPP